MSKKKKIEIDQDLYNAFVAWSKSDNDEELYNILYQKIIEKIGDDRLEHCRLIVEMAGR